jgi:hypothetical protein
MLNVGFLGHEKGSLSVSIASRSVEEKLLGQTRTLGREWQQMLPERRRIVAADRPRNTRRALAVAGERKQGSKTGLKTGTAQVNLTEIRLTGAVPVFVLTHEH